MASELKGKGLEVVLIDFRENPELVRRTVKERGYTAPVGLGTELAEIFHGVGVDDEIPELRGHPFEPFEFDP